LNKKMSPDINQSCFKMGKGMQKVKELENSFLMFWAERAASTSTRIVLVHKLGMKFYYTTMAH